MRFVVAAAIYHAVARGCTHMAENLSDGKLDGRVVTCPRHGARFDITNGEAVGKAKLLFFAGGSVMVEWLLRFSLPTLTPGGGRADGLASNRSAALSPSAVVSLLRIGLLSGCGVAAGMVGWLGDAGGYLHADPALARLLRGMALIKGMIAIAAVAAVYWRLAWPLSKATATTYLIGCWGLAGSTMLIWQLCHILPAALLFHASALSLLLVSWREG